MGVSGLRNTTFIIMYQNVRLGLYFSNQAFATLANLAYLQYSRWHPRQQPVIEMSPGTRMHALFSIYA